jgi:predicted nucleic acid-binding protein
VTRVVVDASVAVKWFVPEELSSEARRLLAPEYELMAPDILWVELGNVLWKKHRRRELDQRTATRLLDDLSRVPIKLHPAQRWTWAALDLAIRHGVSVNDGLYLAVAAGNGCRLMTADRKLRDACGDGPLKQIVTWVRDA